MIFKKLTISILFALSLTACTATVDKHGNKHYEVHDFPRSSHRYDAYNERLKHSNTHYDGYPYDKMRGKHCSPGHVKKGWC